MSVLPEGQQHWQWVPVFSSLLLLILLIPTLKLSCPWNASYAWLHLSLFTWVLPGGPWYACVLAFSFLQAESNFMFLMILPACLCSSILEIKFIAFISQQTILPPFLFCPLSIPSAPLTLPLQREYNYYSFLFLSRKVVFISGKQDECFCAYDLLAHIVYVSLCFFQKHTLNAVGQLIWDNNKSRMWSWQQHKILPSISS